MATFNRTREGSRNQKKGVCVAAATIDMADIPASGDIAELFDLPENALVTGVRMNVKTAFTGGSASAATLLMALGGATISAAMSIFTTGVKTLTVTSRDTGVGGIVTAVCAFTGGVPTVGSVEVMVEYIEYTKNTGELTNYSTT